VPSHDRTYRTAEFAALGGVTVRALRHYDRLGLLRPRRTTSGYRVYTAPDLEILEQIVALKFIGVPLKQISALRRGGSTLADALRAQRHLLEQKAEGLRRAIDAIAEAESALRAGRVAGETLFRTIIGVIEMQQNDQDWAKEYTALLDAKIATLTAMPVETRRALRQQWAELVQEIRESLDQDPAGPRAQSLAERWTALLGQVSGAVDPAWKDFVASPEQRPNLQRLAATLPPGETPAGGKPSAEFLDPDVWSFIRRALAARP
jgi:DNA-binding transcriptional MerR regulator